MFIGMRCPSCGTENAPDSRFCGGCGARLEPARVAPTVKLHDDARMPTPVPGAINLGNLPTPPPGSMSYSGPASIPPTNNGASIPPTNHRLASQPPASQPPPSQPPLSQPPLSQPPGPRRASTPVPDALSSPSLSMMPAKRSGAMIAVILVLDLALAAAGGALLVKGLAKPKPADAKPASAAPHAQAAAAPTPAAVAVTSAAPAGSAAAPEPPPPSDKTVAREAKKKPTAAKDIKKKADVPLDPYAGAAPPAAGTDQTAEIDAQARESFGAFRRCFTDAIHGSPIHGDIRIAFVVQPDGHVSHSSPVVNTTGSDALASCLAQTIGAWTFAPHSGPAASYERPFNYQ